MILPAGCLRLQLFISLSQGERKSTDYWISVALIEHDIFYLKTFRCINVLLFNCARMVPCFLWKNVLVLVYVGFKNKNTAQNVREAFVAPSANMSKIDKLVSS